MYTKQDLISLIQSTIMFPADMVVYTQDNVLPGGMFMVDVYYGDPLTTTDSGSSGVHQTSKAIDFLQFPTSNPVACPKPSRAYAQFGYAEIYDDLYRVFKANINNATFINGILNDAWTMKGYIGSAAWGSIASRSSDFSLPVPGVDAPFVYNGAKYFYSDQASLYVKEYTLNPSAPLKLLTFDYETHKLSQNPESGSTLTGHNEPQTTIIYDSEPPTSGNPLLNVVTPEPDAPESRIIPLYDDTTIGYHFYYDGIIYYTSDDGNAFLSALSTVSDKTKIALLKVPYVDLIDMSNDLVRVNLRNAVLGSNYMVDTSVPSVPGVNTISTLVERDKKFNTMLLIIAVVGIGFFFLTKH